MYDKIIPIITPLEYSYQMEDRPTFYSRRAHAKLKETNPTISAKECFDYIYKYYIDKHYQTINADFLSLPYGTGRISEEGANFTKIIVQLNIEDYNSYSPFSTWTLKDWCDLRHLALIREGQTNDEVTYWFVTNAQLLGKDQIQYSLEMDIWLTDWNDRVLNATDLNRFTNVEIIRTHVNRVNLNLIGLQTWNIYPFDFTPNSYLYLHDDAMKIYTPSVSTTKQIFNGISRTDIWNTLSPFNFPTTPPTNIQIINDTWAGPVSFPFDKTNGDYWLIANNLYYKINQLNYNGGTATMLNGEIITSVWFAYAILSYENFSGSDDTSHNAVYKGSGYPFIIIPLGGNKAKDWQISNTNQYNNFYNHPNLVNIILTPYAKVPFGAYTNYSDWHTRYNEDITPIFHDTTPPTWLIYGDLFFGENILSTDPNGSIVAGTRYFPSKSGIKWMFLPYEFLNILPPDTKPRHIEDNNQSLYRNNYYLVSNNYYLNQNDVDLNFRAPQYGLGIETYNNYTILITIEDDFDYNREPKIFMAPHYKIDYTLGLRSIITWYNELIFMNILQNSWGPVTTADLPASTKYTGTQLMWENLFGIDLFGVATPQYSYYTATPSCYNSEFSNLNYYDNEYNSKHKFVLDGNYLATSMSNAWKNFFQNYINTFQVSKEANTAKLATDAATAPLKVGLGAGGGALFGAAIGAILGPIGEGLGALIGAIVGGATAAAGSAAQITNDVMNRKQIYAGVADLANQPETLNQFASKDFMTDLFWTQGMMTFNELNEQQKQIVANYYNRYGYLIDGGNNLLATYISQSNDEIGLFIFSTNRLRFHFWQIHGFSTIFDLTTSKISQIELAYFEKLFSKNGIRLWCPEIDGDNFVWKINAYGKENWENVIGEDQGWWHNPFISLKEENHV